MTRLYDRMIRRGDFDGIVYDDFIKVDYINAPVINIGNAVRYFVDNYYKENSEWSKYNSFDEFPTPIPPFDFTFMEYDHHRPKAMVSATGFLILSKDFKDFDTHYRWEVKAFIFMEHKKQWSDLVSVFDYAIYDDGDAQFFGFDPGWLFSSKARSKSEWPIFDMRVMHFALFALSLMNTKNVELIDHIPPPQLSKKHEKKYGQPLVTYKTIKVNPMRTVTRMDGDDVPSAERDTTSKELMPLHIVAGNFADYRDGPGLFGKPELKGVFWRPQHIRGTAKRGVVVKDYEVQAPESDE